MDVPLPAWLDRREFPFTPRLVDIGGGERLSATDIGTGPPVLLAHGTPTWSYDWRRLIARLAPTHRCIAPDHLGFGLSPRPADADYGPAAHADRFRRLRDRLVEGRYSLVVHDFGGPIALDSALDDPDRLDTLVVINSFMWPFGDTSRRARMVRLAGSPLFRWLYRHVNFSFVIARSAWGDRRTLSRATWAPYLPLFPDADSRERVLFALARSMGHDTPYFERLWQRRDRLARTRILLLWGMKDSAFPPDVLARFESAWPHATTCRVAGAGHWPIEEQPERCVDAITAALAGR